MPEDNTRAAPAETRKLAAIMFTDIVGFSRQMGSDEARMLKVLAVHNQIIQQAVAEHHGHVIKTMGDGFLVDFPSVINAVQCAQYIQAQFRTHNAEKDKDEQIHVRVGIHLGDIIQQNGDVLGDGVNVASRLQALAEPDTICISQAVYKEIEKKLPLDTVIALGKPKLKNIAQREPVYSLLPEPPKGLRQTLQVQRVKLKHKKRTWQGAVAVLLLIVASSGAILLRERYFASSPGLPFPDKPSIAVLPFVNMSGDSEQEYFSDGITEDITTDLSKIVSLFVISRNSAFTYKGKAVKVQDVSREMGVRYILEGSVRRSDSQFRITAQLIDALTGGHMWSERYERPLQEIFAVQDEIRQQIVFALKVKLAPEEQAPFKRAPTTNLEAYDFFLRGGEALGRAWMEVKKEANAQAQQMYEKAIELDPKYAGAYAALGFTYWLDYFYGWNPARAQSLERAFALGQRAAALDDSIPLPHRVLSMVYLGKTQHDQAIAEAKRAVALDPNNAEAYMHLGSILVMAGRPEEAIGLIEKAMRLNPHYPPPYLNQLGFAYLMAGRYEEALVPLKKALSLNPNLMFSHLNLAVCYAELGRLEEARAEVAEVLRIVPIASLEWVNKQNAPSVKDPVQMERYLVSLRKAGMK
jgi:adenylate cyclase